MNIDRCQLIVLALSLILMSCDPVYEKTYNLTIPVRSNQGGIAQDLLMEDFINTIDDIAARNGLHRENVDKSVYRGLVIRSYCIHYNEPSSQGRTLYLRVMAKDNSEYMTIKIADIFRSGQSQLSKCIEQDLVNSLKKKYGDKSIHGN